MRSAIQLMEEEMLMPLRDIEPKISKETEKRINQVMANKESRNRIMEEMLKCLNNKGQV